MLIPEEIRTTVLGRLRRLERGHRSVVMRASVIGRHFDLRVVAAAVNCSDSHARFALECACGLQLVVTSGSGRYSFRHALTRDIIYAEFLEEQVRPLHRRIAIALERRLRCGETALELLAYHAWAAADARRGVRYNELAGDNAAAIHARDDARTCYARARSLAAIGSAAHRRLTQKLSAIDGS